jgi:hypothetical protein
MSSVSNAVAMGQMQVAIARKQLDTIEQQGQNAVELIEAAATVQKGAPQTVQPGVGARLNVVA